MSDTQLNVLIEVIGHTNFPYLPPADQKKIRKLSDEEDWSEKDWIDIAVYKAELERMRPGKRTMYLPAIDSQGEDRSGLVEVSTVYLGERD